jgi:uncharacterized protein (DUF2141 family)
MRLAALLIAGLAAGLPARAQEAPAVEFLPIPDSPPAYMFAPAPLAGTMLKPLSGPTPETGAEVAPEPGTAEVAIARTLPETAPSEAPAPAAAPETAYTGPEAGATTEATPLEEAAPVNGRVTVIVENVESDDGVVRVAVCDKGLSREGCPYSHEVKAAKGFVETEFADIPPGTYAVVGYHDVNGNDEFDKVFGMPREPYALSSKAAEMLVPSFSDAALPINAGNNAIIIRLRRLGG